MRWDIMNQNVLISTALISSLWDSQHKDTLDLIMPFLKYSISKNTSVGNKLNIDDIASFFKAEFGYESIPRNVLLAMLERLSPNILKKEHRSFYLIAELDDEIISFEKRRTLYKEHRESVGNALALYLNSVVLKLKQPYNCETALLALINFFVKKV